MSNVIDSLEKLGYIKQIPNANIEIEVRFFIDERKKKDLPGINFSAVKTAQIAKDLINKYKGKSSKITQTINFMDDENIKQMVFIDGEQQKDLMSFYKKDKIINSLYLAHAVHPTYKLDAAYEVKIPEFSTLKAKFGRCRLRYTIVLSKNWQLDITLVKNITDLTNANKIKSIKTEMFPIINKENFNEKAPWIFADIIEFEAEYIGSKFSPLQLLELDSLFENIIEVDNSNLYQDTIYSIAKIINPKMAGKFKERGTIKQLGNQVIELNKNIFYKNLLSRITDYYITDKVDGVRTLLYISDGICKAVNTTINEFHVETKLVSLFDSEALKIGDTINYYIFDVLMINGKNLMDKPFSDRYNSFKEAASLNERFKLKTFEKLDTNFQKQILKFKSSVKTYPIDGIILTPSQEKYRDMKVYKYKPIDKLTIDFVIKKCPDKLLGIKPYVIKPNKTLYILFCGINKEAFINMRCKFIKFYQDIFPKIDPKYLPQYFPYQFQPSNCTYAHLYWDENATLDGSIGEFICETCIKNNKLTRMENENIWSLIKIRDDRKIDFLNGTYYGNYFKVAELNWMSYSDPLVIEDIDIGYFQEHDNPLQKSSRNFNSFVKGKIFDRFNGTKWTIDLASGKGQDLFRYSTYNFENVIFVEVDNVALTELIERKFQLSSRLNILTCRLNLLDDYKSNLALMEKVDIPHEGVDLVVCNFAFHYFIENKSSLLNVMNFISYYLKAGGRFIFTSFDGMAIFNLLKDTKKDNKKDTKKEDTKKDNKKDEWLVKNSNGDIVYGIKSNYNSKEISSFGQQIDVMLPFSKNEYYTEYLVNIESIKSELSKIGFVAETDEPFSDWLEDYAKENPKGYKEMSENDKKYSGLYHVYGFYKKPK